MIVAHRGWTCKASLSSLTGKADARTSHVGERNGTRPTKWRNRGVKSNRVFRSVSLGPPRISFVGLIALL